MTASKMLPKNVIVRIVEKYGFKVSDLSSVQSGYRNNCYKVRLVNGDTINLIVYKQEPGIINTIRRANIVSLHAAASSFPVRTPVSTRILQVSSGVHQRYAGVYTYLPGRTIPWESYSKKHIKLLGWTMSDLHASFETMPSSSLVKKHTVVKELTIIHTKMTDYFSRQGVRRAQNLKLGLKLNQVRLDRLGQALNFSSHLPSQHALHMDLVRGNLLFLNNAQKTGRWRHGKVELSGVLDFEKTAHGPAVFDIARSLAFLLVDCPRYSEKKVKKYLLVSGYNKRGKASFTKPHVIVKNLKIDLLEEYVQFFLLYDFYKFLRHTPYESLEQNHHFLRTRDILIERNMIQINSKQSQATAV